MQPPDALISADSGVSRPWGYARGGMQIAQFGTTPGGHLRDQVADYIGYARRAGDSATFGDLQAKAEGDTVGMDRERAEAHLRLLAEAELRPVMTRAPDSPAESPLSI